LLSSIFEKRDIVEMTYGGALGSTDILKKLRGRLVRVTVISALRWAGETMFEMG